ncbi:hypothetical protein [Amaricoccus solimangrovi]|uniref:PepSY domain-containing protein n=1 Tax=Amaricoccus solimangrovi TaxID=2589815 RepID=A0A501WK37_9RHOB|nr:hypothetical protein [Amaricoccus solimangrovi]TPE50223.1 hypothetical protein FJM51_12625 [Amaricoccus solimangrovi]
MIRIAAGLMALSLGSAAWAASPLDAVLDRLRTQGFTDFEVSRTGDQLRIEAKDATRERELVYDSRTGKLLSDETGMAGAGGAGHDDDDHGAPGSDDGGHDADDDHGSGQSGSGGDDSSHDSSGGSGHDSSDDSSHSSSSGSSHSSGDDSGHESSSHDSGHDSGHDD